MLLRLWIGVLVTTLPLCAQLTQSSLSGSITDSHGAAVAKATVAATAIATGVTNQTKTNEAGSYVLAPLTIGAYVLTVEAPGFHRARREGITLTSGQSLDIDVQLEVGAISETVAVNESSSILDTRTSESGTLIEAKSVEEMPLGDRRAMNIIEITGAAVFVSYDSGARPNFVLAGGRAQSQMIYLDGGTAQNMRLGVGQLDTDPPAETLQELRILANAFSAEYGGTASGVIIANTKSGTNRFKGSLFEYCRNQVLDAPNFFSPTSGTTKLKPSLRYNVFGGTVGGPIRKDKTFFFFAYEGSRRRDGSVRSLNVPSLLERAGDFSQTRNARGVALIYDPATSRQPAAAVLRDPFPGNIIPAARLDAVARKLVDFYPLPNRTPDDITGANNFRGNDVNALTRDFYTLKVDHQIGVKNRVAARYLYNTDVQSRKSVYPVAAADTVNASDAYQSYYYGAWTRIFTPVLISETRLTYGRRQALTFSRGFGENWPSKIGLKNVSDDAFPYVAPAGYAALGSTTQERRQFPIQQYQLIENVSYVRGHQTWKAGAEWRPSLNYEVFRPSASGNFTFSRGYSGLPGNAFTGNGFATMLLGTPTAVTVRETDVLDRRSSYAAWFAQNDWNVRPGLTLNLGMRWEFDSPLADVKNRFNGFDLQAINPVSKTPGVVRFGGRDGYRSRPFDADLNNFAPRVGFAWMPRFTKGTVVRSAFGVFFAHPFDRAVANLASLGFEQSAQLNIPDNNVGVPYRLETGLPLKSATAPVLNDSFGATPIGATATQAVTFFEENRRTGYSLQFNFGIQKELPGRAVVEAGYIGNLSRKLANANLSINQIAPDRVQFGTGQANRPFPQFSGVSIIAPSNGVSSYHAALVKLEKRFAKGFNILATYTWSKFLDNSDTGSGASLGREQSPYSNFYNRKADWGPSENDVRHRLTWSSVFQWPFGDGRRFLSERSWYRGVVSGWSTGLVFTAQTGAPITIYTLTNTTNVFSAGALRADVSRNPNLPAGERTVERWFDTAAFTQPAQFRFGNQGVGLVRAPGIVNANASLLRTFTYKDRYQAQFRGEVFNLANHTNLQLPGSQYEGPGFGVINSARPARQVQLGLRLLF